jgi:hypothetical protein
MERWRAGADAARMKPIAGNLSRRAWPRSTSAPAIPRLWLWLGCRVERQRAVRRWQRQASALLDCLVFHLFVAGEPLVVLAVGVGRRCCPRVVHGPFGSANCGGERFEDPFRSVDADNLHETFGVNPLRPVEDGRAVTARRRVKGSVAVGEPARLGKLRGVPVNRQVDRAEPERPRTAHTKAGVVVKAQDMEERPQFGVVQVVDPQVEREQRSGVDPARDRSILVVALVADTAELALRPRLGVVPVVCGDPVGRVHLAAAQAPTGVGSVLAVAVTTVAVALRRSGASVL